MIFLEDGGQTAFLPHCAVVPSEVVAGYLAGGGVDGKLVITHGLTGRMAEWRVSLEDLGARLGELTAPREQDGRRRGSAVRLSTDAPRVRDAIASGDRILLEGGGVMLDIASTPRGAGKPA